MMAQAHEVHYLTYVETDLGSPITLCLHVSQHRVYVKPLFNSLIYIK